MSIKFINHLFVYILIVGLSYTSGASQKLVKPENKQVTSKSATLKSKSGINLLSFRQWKNERIQETTSKLNVTRSLLNSQKVALNVTKTHSSSKTEAVASRDILLVKLENQMRLDLMSLELAKDLTVTDYFVGYVNKIQNKKDHMSDIAGKMSTEEVTELMSAYSQSIFGSSSSEMPKTATNEDNKQK